MKEGEEREYERQDAREGRVGGSVVPNLYLTLSSFHRIFRELSQNVFFVRERQLSAVDNPDVTFGSSNFDNHVQLAPSYLLSWSRCVCNKKIFFFPNC